MSPSHVLTHGYPLTGEHTDTPYYLLSSTWLTVVVESFDSLLSPLMGDGWPILNANNRLTHPVPPNIGGTRYFRGTGRSVYRTCVLRGDEVTELVPVEEAEQVEHGLVVDENVDVLHREQVLLECQERWERLHTQLQ